METEGRNAEGVHVPDKARDSGDRFLEMAGRLVAATLDDQAIIARVADLVVPRLADLCVVDISPDDAKSRRVACAAADPAKRDLLHDLTLRFPDGAHVGRPLTSIHQDGQPVLLATIAVPTLDETNPDDEYPGLARRLAPRSFIGVPLVARGRALGVLGLWMSESGRHFAAEDLDEVRRFADHCALALDTGRRYQEARRQSEELRRLNDELRAEIRRRDDDLARARAERDDLRQILDEVPEGVAITDAFGNLVLLNAAGEALLGRPPLVASLSREGSPGYRLDGTADPSALQALTGSVLTGETIRGAQLLVENQSTGERRPVLASFVPLRDTSGRITGALGVFQDITAIKELEQQKDDFLAAVSHDLKTPITAIKGYAQLLRRYLTRGTASHQHRVLGALDGIDRTSTRMTTQVNQLLDLARLQMERPLDLDLRETDLVALARRVVSDHHGLSPRHHLVLDCQVSTLVGQWDPARIERLLANLVGNAIKYSPDGGKVLVLLKRHDGEDGPWAVVSIRDHGIGIPAEDLPRIFDRFYRGSNLSVDLGGAGIGLASTLQIVREHHGVISVESAEGNGSVFTVRLPLPRPAPDPAGPSCIQS